MAGRWRRGAGDADRTRSRRSRLIAPLASSHASHPESHGDSLIVRDSADRREVIEAPRRSLSYDHLAGLAKCRAFFDAAKSAYERWSGIRVVDGDRHRPLQDRERHVRLPSRRRRAASPRLLPASSRTIEFVARFGGE